MRNKLITPLLLCLFWLTACFAQTPVSFRYFYYATGELFRVIDSTGTLVEYIIDPAGNVTQINRSTIAPGAPGILNLSSLSGTWGSTFTIYGQNFSAIAANNVVQINGVNVTVISATATQLVVLVSPNATTGQVTVTVNGVTANSGPSPVSSIFGHERDRAGDEPANRTE